MEKKLYTVEEIAGMMMLTSRTIRNYLRDGTLKGRKIGGQWRFTEEDIKAFMDSGNVTDKLREQAGRDVLDFLDGLYTEGEGERLVCSVVDVYATQEEAKALADRACEVISRLGGGFVRFHYDYKGDRARYTVFADPKSAAEIVSAFA